MNGERNTESGQPRLAEPASGGKPDPAAPASELIYCSQCGAAMARADRFCHSCGWNAAAPASSPPFPSVRPPDPNPSGLNRLTVLLLCLFLGWLGVHRFYAGKIGTGVLWLVTAGLMLVGWLYDIILIATGEFRDAQGRRVVYWR